MEHYSVVVRQAPVQKKKRKKLPFVLGGVGLFAALAVVGTTFAAQINLNSNTSIEFGQGSVQAVSCDNNIPLKLGAFGTYPTPGFNNFTIDMQDIDVQSCKGKTFIVRIADQSGDLIPVGPSGETSCTFVMPSEGSEAAQVIDQVWGVLGTLEDSWCDPDVAQVDGVDNADIQSNSVAATVRVEYFTSPDPKSVYHVLIESTDTDTTSTWYTSKITQP